MGAVTNLLQIKLSMVEIESDLFCLSSSVVEEENNKVEESQKLVSYF